MTAGTDTALAHRLLEAGLVDPLLLQGFLGEVRARRGGDPDVSLALLLVERRVVPAAQLETLLYGGGVSLEGSASDLLPQRFGEFEVVRELERGGMGAVLEVRGPQGNRLALKTLLPGGASDAELVARFRREAELTARLDHPHVVRIHAASLEDTPPYLVIDHLPGGTLHERIQRSNGLPLEEALSVGLKLASALQHAHDRSVLHRDLKPENVLFDDRGEPRIIDWGLARSVSEVSQHLTRTGTLLGTPAYMAPEQALATEAVGPAADVYSLGAVLFATLCGRPPFSSPQLLQTLDQVIHVPPPAPTSLVKLGPRGPLVDDLLGRLLAKDPAQRPSLSALREELRQLERDQGERAGLPRWLPAVVVGLLLLICAGVALALATAPDHDLLRQEHLVWEETHLRGYSLDVAPVPSAAELRAARERSHELSLFDEQRTLSDQRFEAYAGLLKVLEGQRAPQVAGAPGAVLAAVEAYRQGDLRRTQRLAKRALSLATQGGPERAERAAAEILLVRSAGDLRELVRLQGELSIEEGPLRAALEGRGADLLRALLSDFPRPNEGWSTATRRVQDELTLARALRLPPQAWWTGLDLAAPRWQERLDSIRTGNQAEDLALALERLDPPGVGPRLRGLLQGVIDRFADRSESLKGDDSKRREIHETLAIALQLDDALAYVDPAYTVSPRTREIAIRQHNGLDPGSSPVLSTACALFALRNTVHLSLNDVRSHLNGPQLRLLLARRPRPRSASQRLAKILDETRDTFEHEGVGQILERTESLAEVLELQPSDLARGIRGLAQLWLAEHYEVLGHRAGVDQAAHFERGAHWAALALENFPPRKRGHNTVQAVHHLARLEHARKGPRAAAELWTPIVGRLRLDYEEQEEGTGAYQQARLALAWALISVGRFRLQAGEHELALRIGREVERLTKRRYGWENWLPQGYEIQARALRDANKDLEAWEALHLDEEIFGSTVGYARLALDLGVKLGKREEVIRAYHASFLRPLPSRERNSRKRSLTLEPREREAVRAFATELGYPPPPEREGD